MAGLISGALADYLEANRDALNQQVLERQRASPGFEPAAFTATLSELVPPVLAAVDARGEGFTALVAQSLFDATLELCAAGQLDGAIRAAWTTLLPQLGRQLVEDPRRIVAAVSNAVANLARTPGARPAQWIATMEGLAARTDAAVFLAAGQVAAWHAGMAAYRRDAVALARTLDASVLRVALDATPDELERLARNPWYDPAVDESSRTATVVRVGSFRGFGGPFVRPPRLALDGEQVVATDGDGEWLVFADAFGSAVVRASGEEAARAVATTGPPPAALDIPELLTWVLAPGAIVASSALSHAVFFTRVAP